MLAKLKEMFGSKGAPSAKPKAKPRKARVNLGRRFSIISETGQGSMSKIYRAMDNQQGRTVCLKVQIPDKNQAAAARTGVELRPDEGEIGMEINHPHVVRTFDYGVSTRNEHFVVMEFVDGNSFQFVREARTTPRLADKLELLAQAAEGLAAVHAAGYLHHDINPRNFLADRDGRVKLIDFGLAVPNTPAFCKPGNRTGTLNYMAPELVRREVIDVRIDVFSFGAMAFELLTDRLPYDATNSMAAMLQRINHEPLDPGKANPRLPADVQELLRKMIARRREHRWPKMDTLPNAFRSIAEKLG